jgi:nitrate reductase gamma subunit
MKYNGVEKDYPLDISVEPESPVAIYAVIASVILLIIIIIILISRRGKNDSKNKKDYDFEMK